MLTAGQVPIASDQARRMNGRRLRRVVRVYVETRRPLSRLKYWLLAFEKNGWRVRTTKQMGILSGAEDDRRLAGLLTSQTPRIRIDQPRWDQSTFQGRFRHFASITDPRCVFVSTPKLVAARKLVADYKASREPPSTTMADLWRAQQLFGSAFHPDTGDLQNIAGRMCFNVYGGTILCGAMIIWYRSTPAVLFWQWANQSFNALVNYTNRNANSPLSTQDLVTAYGCAVTGALGVAVGLKGYLARRAASGAAQRLVPLAAVAMANAINLPLMRQNELRDGLPVVDSNGQPLGTSRLAAAKAISLVVLSRNVMVTPTMLFIPLIMERLGKKDWFVRNASRLNVPLQLVLTFVLFGSMVPVGCALFPQLSSIEFATLERWEPEAAERIRTAAGKTPQRVFYNKGL